MHSGEAADPFAMGSRRALPKEEQPANLPTLLTLKLRQQLHIPPRSYPSANRLGTGSFSKAVCRLSGHVVVSMPPPPGTPTPSRLASTSDSCFFAEFAEESEGCQNACDGTHEHFDSLLGLFTTVGSLVVEEVRGLTDLTAGNHCISRKRGNSVYLAGTMVSGPDIWLNLLQS